jgi:hypothetical protein
MDVIFYLSGIESYQTLFEEKVIRSVPSDCRVLCKSLRELSSALRRSMAGRSICVIATGRKKDLLNLLSIKDLLKNSKLILLLPNRSDDMIEIAHTLYPRYLDSVSSDFSNIKAVLNKMSGLQIIDNIDETHRISPV